MVPTLPWCWSRAARAPGLVDGDLLGNCAGSAGSAAEGWAGLHSAGYTLVGGFGDRAVALSACVHFLDLWSLECHPLWVPLSCGVPEGPQPTMGCWVCVRGPACGAASPGAESGGTEEPRGLCAHGFPLVAGCVQCVGVVMGNVGAVVHGVLYGVCML